MEDRRVGFEVLLGNIPFDVAVLELQKAKRRSSDRRIVSDHDDRLTRVHRQVPEQLGHATALTRVEIARRFVG